MPSIQLTGISHSYPEQDTQHMILDGIDLEIQEGKSIGIMGASGSGKSTLLQIISGLLGPMKGEVLYDGSSLWNMHSSKRNQYRAKHMGFMFQKHHFFPELTILENVSLPLRILGDAQAADKAREMLGLVRIDERLHKRYPYELSGGEQARTALARAMIIKPSVFIADEPTSALDDELTQQIFKDIKILQDKLGFTMIVASHDSSLREYFDQVYQLRSGMVGVI